MKKWIVLSIVLATLAAPMQAGLLPGAGLSLIGGVALWLIQRRRRPEFFNTIQKKLIHSKENKHV